MNTPSFQPPKRVREGAPVCPGPTSAAGGPLLRVLAIAAIAVLAAQATIVDRIAVTAGNRVITASEVELRLRLTAFQNGEKPQLTTAARKRAAERLIDQKLVEREMEVGRYPTLSGEDRKQPIRDFTDQLHQSDFPALERALKPYGLTVQELEDDLARQADLLTFLGLRFRPAVQISESDLQQRAAEKKLSLAEFRAQLEQNLANEHADADLETWLREQRKRIRIEYMEKDLAP
jgi:hypothetical protein